MNKRSKNLILTLILAFVLLITTVPNLVAQSQVSAAVNDPTFSIMQISDTQFLSLSFPQLFKDTTSWIVNNSENYNLKMVIHTGDIVDNINSTSGVYSDPVQWNTANIAMSSLLNAGIPYCWDAGNHDQIPWNSASGTWLGSSYEAFNSSSMRSKNYWVSDTADSKNTAVKFSYNGYEFLIINVEYQASNATLAWMGSLLDNNKGANIIIAAHTYLNVKGGYGFASAGLPGEVAWCNNFKKILDGYPNIFLTLSGHDPTGTANMSRVGNREEIFFNRQSATTVAGSTGAAAVRIYTFDLTNMQVNTKTYSLNTQTWLTTASNQFSFNVALARAPTNPYADPTALTYDVDYSFSFMDVLRANHTYVPADKVTNPVQKMTISYDEKPLSCDINVGGVTYSLGKDFIYTGHVDQIYYSPSFANPAFGYLYPSSFSGSEATINYMYNFSAIPGGLEGTLSMLTTAKDAVGSIVSVGGTGDFRNVEVKASYITPRWFEAATGVVNMYHDGMVSGWPHAVPVFMTNNIIVTYAQLTDYCVNVWGLPSNPYPAYPANVSTECHIFNIVIGDKFYLMVGVGPRISVVSNPTAKTVAITLNSTWYFGDSYKGVAKMDQGFNGPVVATLLNYVPANATATPPTPSTYDIGPTLYNLKGFGALSGQNLVLRVEGQVMPFLATGYAILP